MIKNEEFINDFIEESTEHINLIEERLLGIEAGDDDTGALNEVFRAVHSIKGTAGFFGLSNISELSHSMENLLSRMREGRIKTGPEIVDILLLGNDTLRSMVENVKDSQQMDISSIKGQIERILNENTGAVDRARDTKKETDAAVSGANEDNKAEGAVSLEKESGKADGTASYRKEDAKTDDTGSVEKVDVKAEDTGSTGKKNGRTDIAGAKRENGKDESLRVSVGLLNDLMDLAGEMVLGRNQLLRKLEDYVKDNPETNALLQNIDRITTELQEKIMQTRMQPIANVFNRFPRIIRDMSRSMGKKIEVSIEGADVELDKSIIEAIGDPLTHIVRNSADHGIEKPEVRVEKGKPAAGLIQMKAYHEGGQVKVEVADDGAGIDVDKLKERAINSGVITAQEAEDMTEGEILELIFRPGFSTAQKVTDVSGRGVGLDVVKTNIEKLGGVVDIESTIGRGTKFVLTLPLTLAIIPSLIVGVCDQRFALPQVNLQEVVRVKKDNPSIRIEHINNAEVIRLRERLLPLVRLATLLGFECQAGDTSSWEEDITRVLVLKAGSKRFGLVVDRVYDSEEILVKPLPRFIKECKAYSGATILGNGRIALILDPDGIAAEGMLKFPEDRAGEVDNGHSLEVAGTGGRHGAVKSLLIFKCGGPELMAVDLNDVNRVEKIKRSDIEIIGPKTFIRFREKPLRVFRPDEYLPITRAEGGNDIAYVIIPKDTHIPVGILVDVILDTVETEVELDKTNIKSKGLAGSAIINERIVLIIDILELANRVDDVTDRQGSEEL